MDASAASWRPTVQMRPVFNALVDALTAEGTLFDVIAPTVGGVLLDDDTDVVARLRDRRRSFRALQRGRRARRRRFGDALADDATAKDFTDAFAKSIFIAYTVAAMPLFTRAGIAGGLDAGCVELDSAVDAEAFVTTCRSPRHQEREPEVDQTS